MPDTTARRARWLRAALALSGVASLTLGLVLVTAAPPSLAAASSAQVPQARGGSAVTVRGPRMWDPASLKESGFGHQFAARSTVSVSQTRNLVHQSVRVSWTGFSPTDFEGSTFDPMLTIYPVMIAECRGTHPTLSQLGKECYGAASQGNNATFGTFGAFNTVYEGTDAKGRGHAVIDLETITQNTGLGCDAAHPCSLLIMPAQGGNVVSKGALAATAPPFTCAFHGDDNAPGFSTGNASADYGGAYTSCSWAARVVVPIRFAPSASACPASAPALSVAGSPMLATAMNQWDSGLCTSRDPIAVSDIASVPEGEAINQLLGGLNDVALTTLPSTIGTRAGSRRYAYAPVGVTATAIGYWADNPVTGNPQTGLRLDQQLLTKLLTNSYDLLSVSCHTGVAPGCDPNIAAKNPADIFDDPEFTALNPHIASNNNANSTADTPIVMQGESDMTFELTRWIAANPAAEAFLHGAPDKSGMTINATYDAKLHSDASYPTNTFPTNDPSQIMQAAFAPVTGLSGVANDLVLASPPGDQFMASCLAPCTFPQFSQEAEGQRSLFAVMDSGDTAGFDVPVAAIPNHAGRFVVPTDASMAAAVNSMVTAKNGVTQQVNLNSSNPAVYPLTMVVYAMVPTSGVSPAKAALIARWLRYVAGPGQVPGDVPGRLAPGYLPLPSRLRAQTLAVADKVQSGNPAPTPTPSPTPTPAAIASATPTPSPAGSLTPSASPTIALPTATPRLTTEALRDPQTAGPFRYALPVLLIVGGLAALGGASSLIAGSSAGATLTARLRRSNRPGSKRRRNS